VSISRSGCSDSRSFGSVSAVARYGTSFGQTEFASTRVTARLLDSPIVTSEWMASSRYSTPRIAATITTDTKLVSEK